MTHPLLFDYVNKKFLTNENYYNSNKILYNSLDWLEKKLVYVELEFLCSRSPFSSSMLYS